MTNPGGRGYPFQEPKRLAVAAGDTRLSQAPQMVFDPANPTIPQYDATSIPEIKLPGFGNGSLPLQGGNTLPQGYAQKQMTKVLIPMDVDYADQVFEFAGTFIWASGQTQTVATFRIRLDTLSNQDFPFNYGQALSGIPFQRFYITNTAQTAGTVLEITIAKDSPNDRLEVGVT